MTNSHRPAVYSKIEYSQMRKKTVPFFPHTLITVQKHAVQITLVWKCAQVCLLQENVPIQLLNLTLTKLYIRNSMFSLRQELRLSFGLDVQ